MATLDTVITEAQKAIQGGNDTTDNPNKIGEILQVMKEFTSPKDFVLKSRKTQTMVKASSAIKTQNEITQKYTGVCCNVSALYNYHLEHEVVSLNGKGREEMIELVRNLEEKIEQTTLIPGVSKTAVIR
jgi:hypothetical protein